MSVSEAGVSTGSAHPSTLLPRGHTLWWRQVRAIVGIDLRKSLLGRRSLLAYSLAGLPVFVMLVTVLVRRPGGDPIFESLGDARNAYAMIYQTLILRGVIFFGCVGIFTNLFRGEVLDRSLHYYLLSPLRREVLVAAKFVSGLALTSILFVSSTVLSFLLLYPPFGFGRAFDDLVSGVGGGQLLGYISVTLLACLGYGAVFLILGLLFRNPILPAGAVLGWEAIHFLLPPLLKKFSVIHYLKSLIPLPMSEGPFAVVVDPPPAIVSILGLLVFTGVVIVISGVLLRRMEIRYGDD